MSSEPPALPPLVQQWVETYNSGDLAAHIDLYTDDASIVLPGTAVTEVAVPIAVHFTMNDDRTRFIRDRTYVDSTLTAELRAGS